MRKESNKRKKDRGYRDLRIKMAQGELTMIKLADELNVTPRTLATVIHRWREKDGIPRGEKTCQVLNGIYDKFKVKIAQDYP